jgi:hypothetical protein
MNLIMFTAGAEWLFYDVYILIIHSIKNANSVYIIIRGFKTWCF